MSNELTLDDSQPVELYELSDISGTQYFTSDVIDWNIDGNDYISMSGLKRGKVKIGTQENEKDELKIEMPTTEPIVYAWAFATHPPELSIVIKRIDRAVGTSYVYWRGRVSSIEVKGIMAIFKCPTRFVSIMNGRIPRINIQPQCNHVLFDSMCGLNRATYTHTRTVTSTFNNFVFFSGGGLPATNPGLGPNNDFLNGSVLNLRTGETRTITATNFTGTSITLNYEFSDIVGGDTIEISQGCDHNWFSDYGCQKYNNLDQFGGFPYIPGEDRNIFQTGVV